MDLESDVIDEWDEFEPKFSINAEEASGYDQTKNDETNGDFQNNQLRSFLAKCELPQEYISTFEENEVEVDDIEFFTERDLFQLIRKVGPRVRFRRKVEELFDIVGNLRSSAYQGSIFAADPLTQSKSGTPCSSNSLKRPNDTTPLDSTKRVRTEEEQKLHFDASFVKNFDIHYLLNSNVYGRAILKHTNERIPAIKQNLLCKLIVDKFLNNRINMSTFEFRTLSEKIVRVFPKESAQTYFVRKRGRDTGQLVDKFLNVSSFLEANGIFNKETDMDIPHESSSNDQSINMGASTSTFIQPSTSMGFTINDVSQSENMMFPDDEPNTFEEEPEAIAPTIGTVKDNRSLKAARSSIKSSGSLTQPKFSIPASSPSTLSLDKLNSDNVSIKQLIRDIHVRLDKVLKSNQSKDKPGSPELKPPLLKIMSELPIRTKEDLISFDQKIRTDMDFKAYLIYEFNRIFGTDGKAVGFKIAYRLSDHLFDRELLTKFTWTGATKSKDQAPKDVFQKFQGILNLFVQIVQKADDHYNERKNIDFFMNRLLKHSKKRSERKIFKSVSAYLNDNDDQQQRNDNGRDIENNPEGDIIENAVHSLLSDENEESESNGLSDDEGSGYDAEYRI